MKAIIYTISFIFLTSCLITKDLSVEQVTGKYQLNIDTYGIVKTIELSADSTFVYDWVEGLNSGSTAGVWKIEGDKIVLNSYCQHEIEADEIVVRMEKNTLDSDSLLIQVIDINNNPIPFTKCFTTFKSKVVSAAYTNINGRAKLSKSNADSLIIRNVDFGNVQLKHDPLTTYYKIVLKSKYINFRSFQSEEWEYKNNRLYYSSKGKNKFNTDYYRKID